jgi:hypothetical protein
MTVKKHPSPPIEEAEPALRAFPIDEFCRRYGIGRTMAYAEIAAGRLHAVKARRRTLITAQAADEWLRGLPALTAPRSIREPMRGAK